MWYLFSKPAYLLRYWLPIIIYCVLIFFQSANPTPVSMPKFLLFDKLLHFAAYAFLGAMFLRALRTLPLKNRPVLILSLSILLSTLYGFSDELHQHFVPARQADLWDALADMLGSVAGVWTYHKAVSKDRPVLARILD